MSIVRLKGLAVLSFGIIFVVGIAFALNSYIYAEEAEGKDVVLKVSGMTCGGCEKKVQTALEGCKGVISAKVSVDSGDAVVTVKEEECKIEELIEAVKKAGFGAETGA